MYVGSRSGSSLQHRMKTSNLIGSGDRLQGGGRTAGYVRLKLRRVLPDGPFSFSRIGCDSVNRIFWNSFWNEKPNVLFGFHGRAPLVSTDLAREFVCPNASASRRFAAAKGPSQRAFAQKGRSSIRASRTDRCRRAPGCGNSSGLSARDCPKK